MICKAQLTTRLESINHEGAKDEITHSVKAMVAVRDDGGWTVRYHDEENGGQTSLSGCGTWMTLQREGMIRSRMHFEVPWATNALIPALYVTPNGEFEMTTRTLAYAAVVDETRGEVALEYDLFISGHLVARNKLTASWQSL